MRIVTYRRRGEERDRLGVLAGDGRVADLSGAARREGIRLPGTMRDLLIAGSPALRAASRAIRRLASAARAGDRAAARHLRPRSEIVLRPPVPNPEKIVCIGQNYRDHCAEQGVAPPKEPVLFSKWPPALIGDGEPIVLPRIARKVDYEAELAFVIGRGGRHVRRRDALQHVAGFMALNDVSARDLQFADGQWTRGKSCETFAPCGPALVTRDEVPEPHRLSIRLDLNGRRMQDSSTRQMVFGVAYLVWFISRVCTVKPGDIVSTGTPPGVGHFREPPVYLKPGDRVRIEIEGIGTLENPVVRERGP